jgi:hypothetical protein
LGAHYLHGVLPLAGARGRFQCATATSDLQAARQEEKNVVGILPRHQDHWPRRSP